MYRRATATCRTLPSDERNRETAAELRVVDGRSPVLARVCLVADLSELVEAVERVWRIPPPGPANLLTDPRFLTLAGIIARRCGGEKVAFSLSNALRNLGLPCAMRASAPSAVDGFGAIAAALERTFSVSTTTRRHLCPLDFADDLPALSFGRARIDRFSSSDLQALFDRHRLERVYSGRPVDFSRLAQLQWLVVEEKAEIDPRPEARAIPILFELMDRDLGAFDPLARRYPAAVEQALVALLLAPWEDWATMLEVDWRGFRLPWVYTVDDDLAVQPMAPPDAEALTFEPVIYHDNYGEEIEDERPSVLPLEDGSSTQLEHAIAEAWRKLEASRGCELFQTPIEHFLVRAYLSGGIDELLAHMTVLEAALGEEADHDRRLRPKPERNLSATDRMARKIAGLLGDQTAADSYRALFKIRSLFVHGRAGLSTISTEQKVMARRLSRRVVNALLDQAAAGAPSRAAVLAQHLTRGAP